MKKILYFLTTAVIMSVVVSSCKKVPLPYDTFNDLQKGAFARELSREGKFNFFDIDGSEIKVTVEFYDEAQGKNVASYNWTVEYVDKVNDGANSVGPVDFASYNSDSFGTSEAGYPSVDMTFGFRAAMNALGLTAVDGGNTFVFHATIVLKDGRTFDEDNTGSNIFSSSTFKALFTLNADIICPSNLEGVLDYTTQAWCGNTISSSVEWIADGNGRYHIEDNFGDFSYGAYDACYGDGTPGSAGFGPEGTLQLVDACGKLSMAGASQWGEKYWFNDVQVSADKKTLTLDWENDYGEAGITDLVRQDGADWPDLSNGS